MDTGIFLLLVFVCHSHQRPQLELDDPTTTAETPADTTTEETATSMEKIVRTTTVATATAATATAVTVQSSINVTRSYEPTEVFGGFKPSKHYRPDGYPVFERPGSQVAHGAFLNKPQHSGRPNGYLMPPASSRPDEKNVVFPQATRDHYNYSERLQHNGTGGNDKNVRNHSKYNNNNGGNREHGWTNSPESKGPYRFTEVLPQFKPIKHDHGEIVPDFSTYDSDFYEKHFAKYYHGNEMQHYPDVVYEPVKSYNNIAIRKKNNDPWRSVLSVLATILPVGLLLASFPPTVIKINSTQYPYQFQKNSTAYHPSVYSYPGVYKAQRRKNAGRKINGQDDLSEYLDGCLKKKICENMKANHSPSELNSLLRNYKLNTTDDDINHRDNPMKEIAEAAVSTLPESCQAFVCSN